MVHTAKYSLRPYHAVGLGLRGEVLIQRGKLDEGIVLLEQSLDRLRTDRHQILDAAFMSDLAQALALAGQPDRASKTIALAIETVGDNTSFHVPEMHRINGEILAGQVSPNPQQAEACFRKSLELARAQSAMSWELKSATSLARLWRGQGRFKQADDLLRPLYGRFTEGFETADLRAARLLLDDPAPRQKRLTRRFGD
jgi:predicted ATPase